MLFDESLEVERLKNLVINFDWELTRQEIIEDYLVVTLKKKRKNTSVELSAGPS